MHFEVISFRHFHKHLVFLLIFTDFTAICYLYTVICSIFPSVIIRAASLETDVFEAIMLVKVNLQTFA